MLVDFDLEESEGFKLRCGLGREMNLGEKYLSFSHNRPKSEEGVILMKKELF
jgi:hypothetical protein